MTTTTTQRQTEILRHTLGADSRSPGYRNHYAAEPNGDNYADILALVEMGLMKRGRDIPGGLIYFHVTEAGQELIGVKETP